MSREAAKFEALLVQIDQLTEIDSKRPNPMVKRRLAECIADKEALQKRLAGFLAEHKPEKETVPAEKTASRPQEPVPSVPVPRSSQALPTKREQQMFTAHSKCVQAERAAREARVYLNGLAGELSSLPLGQRYDRRRQWLNESISNASKDVRTKDDLVLAAKERVAKSEMSVRGAHAKAQQLVQAQEHRKLAERPSSTESIQRPEPTKPVDEPSHQVDEANLHADKPAVQVDQSNQQLEGPDHEVEDTVNHVEGNGDDDLGWDDAFAPITAKELAPVIPEMVDEEITCPEDLKEKDLVNLEGDDICFPIAALIVGLMIEGVRAIGVMPDSLQMTSRWGVTHDVACLTRPDKMIIPLMLETSEYFPDCGTESYDGHVVEAVEKAQVELTRDEVNRRIDAGQWIGVTGHWLLVIAKRSGAVIDLTFLNSVNFSPGPGYDASESVVRRIVRNVIRHSGWMGTTVPSWGKEIFEIPHFQRGGNTCGTHVVVNAWATILGLELNELDDWGMSEGLYKEARFLMMRATKGDLSASEIEAWLIAHNKVWERKNQPAVDSELANILRAHTVAMKGDIFSEFIEQVNNEVAAPACHVNISGANPSTNVSNPVSLTPTTTTTDLPISKPTTADIPVVDTSFRPTFTAKPWASSGYVVNTSDEEDSTSSRESQGVSASNVSKTKPALTSAPKPAIKASSTKSTAAKTSLPKAASQPEPRRSGRIRQTVPKAPGFVSSLAIPEAEVSVVPAKRKAADSDLELFDDNSTLDDSHESDDARRADDSEGGDDGGDNDNDAANNIEAGAISIATKSPRTGQWTTELRYQAFGLLQPEETRQLARKADIAKDLLLRRTHTRDLAVLWKELALSAVEIPSHVANLDVLRKMQYKEGDLGSLSFDQLWLEIRRLCIKIPRSEQSRESYIRLLKDHVRGTATLCRPRFGASKVLTTNRTSAESAEYKELRARASQLRLKYRVYADGKARMLTSDELRENISKAEERQEKRLALEVDNGLPRIQITRQFKLVLLVFRYSSSAEKDRLEKDRAYLQDIEQALRRGRILANLENAEYQYIIWQHRNAKREMPLRPETQEPDMVTCIRKFQQSIGKNKAEAIIVICGIEGLSVNGPSYQPFLETFQGIKFTLLIGENLNQWTNAGILWADSDWIQEEMDRRWAVIDLGILMENPRVCRLYTDLLRQWELCAGGRTGLSNAVALEERPTRGRGALAKRRKE
ncbi:MAG: hypothetical protein Q9204_003201 [Flavoplaca sp. TL-2023a]